MEALVFKTVKGHTNCDRRHEKYRPKRPKAKIWVFKPIGRSQKDSDAGSYTPSMSLYSTDSPKSPTASASKNPCTTVCKY